MENNFNDIINFYKQQLKETLKASEAQKAFDIGITHANNILRTSKKHLTFYFDTINGTKIYSNTSSLNFPQRFLKGNLNDEQIKLINTITIECFMIGFIFHFVFCTFPTREKIELIDFDRLYEAWIVDSLIADIQLKKYNEDQNNDPVEFFELYYTSIKYYDKIFKDKFKIGFLKNGRIHSFMRNIMFSGALYSMGCDMATKGIYHEH